MQMKMFSFYLIKKISALNDIAVIHIAVLVNPMPCSLWYVYAAHLWRCFQPHWKCVVVVNCILPLRAPAISHLELFITGEPYQDIITFITARCNIILRFIICR